MNLTGTFCTIAVKCAVKLFRNNCWEFTVTFCCTTPQSDLHSCHSGVQCDLHLFVGRAGHTLEGEVLEQLWQGSDTSGGVCSVKNHWLQIIRLSVPREERRLQEAVFTSGGASGGE